MKAQHIGFIGFLGVGGVLSLIGLLPPLLAGLFLLIGAGAGWRLFQTRPSENPASHQQRQLDARTLRSIRERERAFYEMTTTLSATLDYQKVLEAAHQIGELASKGKQARIVSAALLFQGEELHIASSRGLTRADEARTCVGKEGVIGLTLKQAEPVFASMPDKDPELGYFVAFHACKSILSLPLRAGYDQYGVLIFGSDQPDSFSDDYVELLKAISTQVTLALQNANLYQNILEEKERIVEVEEDARKKLARDLHDGPTQSVSVIAMRMNYLKRMIQDKPQQAIEEIGKIEDLARKTTKEIRHMLFTLRPLILETQGLVAALHQFAEKMRDTHDLNVLIEAQPGVEKWLDSNAQGVAFYVIEEAVNNARKHAQSRHIWVRLRRQDSYIVFEIEDDGVGFNISKVENNYHERGSLGMVNMRERAQLIEGTLHMTSREGEGTKISVIVPVRDQHTPTQTTPAVTPAASTGIRPSAPTPNPSSSVIRRITDTNPVPPNKPKSIPHASKRSPNS